MNQDATDPLAELTHRFINRTKTDADRIRSLASAMSGPSSPGYREVRQLVHRLAGSAGTFGYDDMGESAARLDTLMNVGCADINLICSRLTSLLTEIDAMTDPSGQAR